MKIRKAKKEDLNEYVRLRRDFGIEHAKILGEKKILSDNKFKKEFEEALSSRDNILLVVANDKNLIGFLWASIQNKTAFVDIAFVSKENRRKGLARSLIKELNKLLKQKNINQVQLSVNIKNKVASKFYQKVGFSTYSFRMAKKIK